MNADNEIERVYRLVTLIEWQAAEIERHEHPPEDSPITRALRHIRDDCREIYKKLGQ